MPLTTPIDVKWGDDADRDLDCFVYNNIITLKGAYDDLHNTKVPNWRRLAKGLPKDKSRSFPWPGASNTVIQLIGENIDTLKAIQIGSIYEILPIWVAGLVGDWPDDEKGEEQRAAYEQFMDLMALKKEELDLYRVESLAANDIAEFGMVVVKAPWITRTEAIVTGVDSLDRGKLQYEEKTIYDGPRPEKLNIQDWAATPTAATWGDARFKYHGPYKLGKDEIQEKLHKGQFDDNEQTRKVLSSPDRQGLDTQQSTQLENNNITSWNPNKHTAEWDFYECWFWYNHNNVKYRIIYIYHLATKTRMKAIYNFYADNEEPFEFGRLGYTDDGLIGYGFAEMGEMYQEQVSTQHNQRNDHGTLQNTSIILTGGNSHLDANFGIYPMACLPIHPDDFAVVQLGGTGQFSNIDDEMLTISLAKARFGTDSGLPSGSGSGTATKGSKGGGPGYSAQGTFSIMQSGARRVNINVTDFRYLHLGLGNKCGRQYADFGIGDRIKSLGPVGKELLLKALENIKKKRIDLPIKAATASINREVEKQTGMLFVQVMERHLGAAGQIIQGLQNPMVKDNPDMLNFYMGSIAAQSYVMTKLIRAFGYDDISRMQPELKFIEKIRGQLNGQQSGGNSGAQSGNAGGAGAQGVPSTVQGQG